MSVQENRLNRAPFQGALINKQIKLEINLMANRGSKNSQIATKNIQKAYFSHFNLINWI